VSRTVVLLSVCRAMNACQIMETKAVRTEQPVIHPMYRRAVIVGVDCCVIGSPQFGLSKLFCM